MNEMWWPLIIALTAGLTFWVGWELSIRNERKSKQKQAAWETYRKSNPLPPDPESEEMLIKELMHRLGNSETVAKTLSQPTNSAARSGLVDGLKNSGSKPPQSPSASLAGTPAPSEITVSPAVFFRSDQADRAGADGGSTSASMSPSGPIPWETPPLPGGSTSTPKADTGTDGDLGRADGPRGDA